MSLHICLCQISNYFYFSLTTIDAKPMQANTMHMQNLLKSYEDKVQDLADKKAKEVMEQ